MLFVSVLQTFGSVIARAVRYFGNVVFSKQWVKLARSLWGVTYLFTGEYCMKEIFGALQNLWDPSLLKICQRCRYDFLEENKIEIELLPQRKIKINL